MKREELASAVSRQTRMSNAVARDQVDEMVHKILRALRRGKTVRLPGVGKLVTRPARRR